MEDTEILFQTGDHSLVNDLIKIGELTPEEAKHSEQKNVITRAMQPNMRRRARADIYESADIRDGDFFLLCTDGILEQMEDENIKYIFSEKCGGIDQKMKMIIDVTAENRDNHSAVLVHVSEMKTVLPETEKNPMSERENRVCCVERTNGAGAPPSSGKKERARDEISATAPVAYGYLRFLLYAFIISLTVGLVVFLFGN